MRYIHFLGDSLLCADALGMTFAEQTPYVVQQSLSILGCSVRARNLGRSGWSTGQLLNATLAGIPFETPTILVMDAGTNDANSTIQVLASPTPTATSFSVTSGQGVKIPAGAKIIIDGQSRTVLTRSTDAITVTALSGAPTAGDNVTIDTTANLVASGQIYQAAGCSKILITGKHYINSATGSDDTISTQNTADGALRLLQQAAATALSCPYVDLYTVMRALIVAGTYTQGDSGWHVYVANIHLNAKGHTIKAGANTAAIQAQSGWMAALQATQ